MKRVELSAPSTIDGLRRVDVDPGSPGHGELLLRVAASSLNFHDFLVVAGLMPAAAGRVPLSDGVGTVIAVGPDVTAFRPGDRVLGTFFPHWLDGPPTAAKVGTMRGDQVDGFASDYVVMPVSSFTRAPAGLSDLEAATLPCAGLTAWRALFVECRVRPGDTVLIEGTGGVAFFALQFAKMAGATVIALSSSAEKLERLREHGADHLINYRENPAWGAAVRAITEGRGVDHLIEVSGGDLNQVVKACRVGGNIVLIGALSRQPVQFGAGALINANAHLIGMTVGSRDDQQNMVRAIEAHGLKPVIDRVFPLDSLADAFRHMQAKAHVGKICVTCAT